MANLKCGQCLQTLKSQVTDSRTDAEGYSVRRRRTCTGCGFRYTTYEVSRENLTDMALQVLEMQVEEEKPSVRRKSVTPTEDILRESINDHEPVVEDSGEEQVEDYAEEYGVL